MMREELPSNANAEKLDGKVGLVGWSEVKLSDAKVQERGD